MHSVFRRYWVGGLLTTIYAVSLYVAHRHYLVLEHEFWALPFYEWSIPEAIAGILLVGLVFPLIPANLRQPSTLILAVLFLVVYIPSIVITLGSKVDSLSRYGGVLSCLAVGFAAACVMVRVMARSNESVHVHTLSPLGEKLMMGAWLIAFTFLAISFWDTVNFVGLELIYEQRVAGRARNSIEAYSQTYLAYVFSPTLLALGLIKRQFLYVLAALAGFLLMYGITAERTVFLLPFAQILLYYGLRRRRSDLSFFHGLVGSFILVVVVGALFSEVWFGFELIAVYLLFRTIAVPGASLWQYIDVFSTSGYTMWSNVTGLNLLVSAPGAYLSDPRWPQLGYIVADQILMLESNSNANLFAYDGVAAAGAIGVLVISALFGAFLVSLDRVTRNVEPQFVSLVTLPIAIALTNVSLFSILLSFGGLFWIIVFFLTTSGRETRT